ncbi:MAG: ATP-binding cassette domain-containing protein [Candidatus Cloacimonetes bacterium]|nr:ATP-binding cassette domain-containing protein [Candidatus Cloacimonadota bacterium]
MKAIEVNNFSKKFGDFQAVSDLSFHVDPGEIFGFLGRNGAGKTTTIRSLLRIYQPDTGDLLIQNQIFGDHLKNDIGYLPEERGLYTRAKVIDTIMYFARLKGLSRSTASQRASELLELMQLTEHSNKTIQSLSSGMQQKVQIIISIIHKPKLLILDEPFRGLDPINRQIIYDTLKGLKSEGYTILFSSHQIAEIEEFSDRVIMIADGKSRAYGSIQDIKMQFEPRFIQLNYHGKLPHLETVEELNDYGNRAEIKFKENTSPQLILKQLIEADVLVEKFEITRPSLNQIFIQLCGEATS